MSDPFPPSPAPEPDYLGSAAGPEPTGGASRRRWGVLSAVAAGVVLAAGLGSWGIAQLLAGGTSPATAVPSIAVAYLSVDLDPSASQKIEALRMLKKFPAIDKELDLGIRDDLRRWVFEQAQGEDLCPQVDYDRDVAPWLGDRVALAAVPGDDGGLSPLLVVQVGDRDAAASGVTLLAGCDDTGSEPDSGPDSGPDPGPDPGVAFVGDYMLLAEEQDEADAMAAAAEAAPLQDDAGFADWMDRLGEPGVVTGYLSADAPRLILEAAEKEAGTGAPFGPYGDASRDMLEDFKGMAGVLRFSDGSMEAEVAARGLPAGVSSTEGRTGPALGDLPDTTAAALTVSLPEHWLEDYLDTMEGMFGSGEPDNLWGDLEAQTGLALPEDIETLLGDGFSVSLDGSADLGTLSESMDLQQVPAGLRISGDPGEITRVIDLLKAQLGPDADQLVVETGENLVVVGVQPAYVERLLDGGDLGELDTFRRVVPEADRASGALFVNFDAGDGWLESLAEGDAEAVANLRPLGALGISGWRDGDVQHGLLRLTTD